MGRHILHVTAPAFPVQIERLKNPKLRGYPLVIAPPDERAVIYALSDEARQAGIRPGMPVSAALKHCRDVVVLPPDEPLYFKIALEVNRILGRLSPVVEPAQQGHAFVDITGTQRLFGGAVNTGVLARQEIKRQFQMDIRIGVATNKLVSKLAAGSAPGKWPEYVKSGDEARFVEPFRVYLLPQVTRKIHLQLLDFNIHFVRELAQVTLPHLTMLFGRLGIQLNDYSHGIDPRPVLPPARIPAIVEIKLLDNDTNDFEILLAVLLVLVEKATKELRDKKLTARKFRLFLRYSDYKEEQAETRFPGPTDCAPDIFPIAKELLEKILRRRIRVRQLAVKFWDLKPPSAQLSLFDTPQPERSDKMLKAMDKIRTRFGHDAIGFARTLAAKRA
jgi:DNA polymerase-4